MRQLPFSFAVGIASFSTIALELLLTRIYSVTLYYHFAFMVISLAMLGLAIAGVAIYLLPRVFPSRRAPAAAATFTLLFAASTALAVFVAIRSPIPLHNWQGRLGTLAALYASAGLPFLFSGFALSLAIASAKERIGQIYAFDLGGAALGCVFVIPVVGGLGAPGAILVTGSVAALGAALFALAAPPAPGRSRMLRRFTVAVSGGLCVLLLVLGLGESAAKRFGAVRNPGKFLGNRPVMFERWNSFSHITVAPSGGPDHRWIFIDADAATRLWSGTIAADGWRAPTRISEVRVAALAYALRSRGPALIIGPGGGTDVISALRAGVQEVVGVEVNPIIVDDIVRGQYADYVGDLYRHPKVRVEVDEGRSYIRRSRRAFGSIQATLVDTWAASSSGAFTLSENNIYTVEAMEEFLAHLEPGGVVTVTRWYDAGSPKEFLRLVALGREALSRRGVAASAVAGHFVLAADSERRATMILCRDPFTPDDLGIVRERAAADGLRVLFLGGRSTPSEDPVLGGFLRADSSARFLALLPYDATPTTDDHPFFFYNLRPKDLPAIVGNVSGVAINNLGVAILAVLLVFSGLLTLVFVLLPLLLLRRQALRQQLGPKLRLLGYFACLGLGFIMVEIGFMQKFVLFLGHPIYALAVVLATLLGASGAGSATSALGARRWGVRGMVLRSVGALTAVLILYALALEPLFHGLIGLPLPVRIVLASVLISVPGFLMGALLPCGVRTADALGSGIVPWAWALNGSASVVGSILAVGLSMNLGFTFALVVGVGIYALSSVALPAVADGPDATSSSRAVLS
jgi:hypothetical protein